MIYSFKYQSSVSQSSGVKELWSGYLIWGFSPGISFINLAKVKMINFIFFHLQSYVYLGYRVLSPSRDIYHLKISNILELNIFKYFKFIFNKYWVGFHSNSGLRYTTEIIRIFFHFNEAESKGFFPVFTSLTGKSSMVSITWTGKFQVLSGILEFHLLPIILTL